MEEEVDGNPAGCLPFHVKPPSKGSGGFNVEKHPKTTKNIKIHKFAITYKNYLTLLEERALCLIKNEKKIGVISHVK